MLHGQLVSSIVGVFKSKHYLLWYDEILCSCTGKQFSANNHLVQTNYGLSILTPNMSSCRRPENWKDKIKTQFSLEQEITVRTDTKTLICCFFFPNLYTLQIKLGITDKG